jgi:hypothetical protein
LSFFDEADEPQPRQETRRARAGGPPRARSRRPPGGSGRPPGGQHQQEVQTRRLVAAGVVVVIVIAMALLIKSCDSSATTSALKNYNARVYRLINTSDSNARKVLGPTELASGDLTGISDELTKAEQTALGNVTTAEDLHAPSQMAAAQSSLVSVMTMRQQGLLTIANNVQQAASKKTSRDAVYKISRGTSLLYGSDVLYKTLVAPNIAKALNAAGIPIGTGGGDEQPINGGQVIPDLGWLNQTWIADTIGAQLSTKQANSNNDQPNLTHGDQLNYTTVNGQQLTQGGTYTIPAADAQTWALNVTDGGETAENAVGCSIKIQDVSDTGTATIPTIAAGGTNTCTVNLPSKPEAGPYTVTATVAAVPGEKNVQNNSQTYTITFTG